MLNTIFLYGYLGIISGYDIYFKKIDNVFWVLIPTYKNGSWVKTWLVIHKELFPKRRYLLETCILILFLVFSTQRYASFLKL